MSDPMHTISKTVLWSISFPRDERRVTADGEKSWNMVAGLFRFLADDAELRAAGALVFLDFLVGRNDRLGRDEFECAGNRDLAGNGILQRGADLSEQMFHDAVLE